jgi:hypothetical protein
VHEPSALVVVDVQVDVVARAWQHDRVVAQVALAAEVDFRALPA